MPEVPRLEGNLSLLHFTSSQTLFFFLQETGLPGQDEDQEGLCRGVPTDHGWHWNCIKDVSFHRLCFHLSDVTSKLVLILVRSCSNFNGLHVVSVYYPLVHPSQI